MSDPNDTSNVKLIERLARDANLASWSRVASIVTPLMLLAIGGLVMLQFTHYDNALNVLYAKLGVDEDKGAQRDRAIQLETDIAQNLTDDWHRANDRLDAILSELQDMKLALAKDEARILCVEHKTICSDR